jgi:hypothetical protein
LGAGMVERDGNLGAGIVERDGNLHFVATCHIDLLSPQPRDD